MKSGEYLLVNNSQEVETISQGTNEGVSVFMDQEILGEVVQVLGNKDETLLNHSQHTASVEFFEHTYGPYDPLSQSLQYLARNIKSRASNHIQLTDDWYYWLAEKLIRFQRQVDTEIDRLDSVKRSTREELYRLALLARDYMHDNLEEPFELEGLSRAVGLPRYHLIRLFRQVFRVTPYQYFLTCRIQKAQYLLRNSDLSITEVALSCGFPSIVTFSRAFKSITKYSPSQFRASTK